MTGAAATPSMDDWLTGMASGVLAVITRGTTSDYDHAYAYRHCSGIPKNVASRSPQNVPGNNDQACHTRSTTSTLSFISVAVMRPSMLIYAAFR